MAKKKKNHLFSSKISRKVISCKHSSNKKEKNKREKETYLWKIQYQPHHRLLAVNEDVQRN